MKLVTWVLSVADGTSICRSSYIRDRYTICTHKEDKKAKTLLLDLKIAQEPCVFMLFWVWDRVQVLVNWRRVSNKTVGASFV